MKCTFTSVAAGVAGVLVALSLVPAVCRRYELCCANMASITSITMRWRGLGSVLMHSS